MASSASSLHKIRDGAPRHFADRVAVILQLQYRLAEGGYEFCYRKAAYAAAPTTNLMARGIEQIAWSPYMTREKFVSSLDIGIPGVDTVVQVDTFGPNLFWSLTKDAVTTLEDHSDLYGELRYFDGHSWTAREDFDGKACQRIRFKAKFNAAATGAESHKFSYNVVLRDAGGKLVEYEIDPDIKNPTQ
jgi:hypothetical protein